jgi:Ca2+-binding EF-hand superfamily protein
LFLFVDFVCLKIEAVFAKFDKDGDGVLSFEEFRKMLNKDSPSPAPKLK